MAIRKRAMCSVCGTRQTAIKDKCKACAKAATAVEVRKVKVFDIDLDHSPAANDETAETVVKSHTEAMTASGTFAPFPPVLLYEDPESGRKLLVRGLCDLLAAGDAGLDEVDAEVRVGDAAAALKAHAECQAPTPAIETREVAYLKPHPRNVSTYGDFVSPELLASVQKYGILTPLIVSQEDVVLGGHSRLVVANRVNLKTVPVVVRHVADEWEALEVMIHLNRQRQKTNEQIGREALILLEVEKERAKDRQRESGGDRKSGSVPLKSAEPISDTAEAIEVVAAEMNIGKDKARHLVAVVKEIDARTEKGNANGAQVLREALNEQSVNAAWEMLPKPTPKKAAPETPPAEDAEPADDEPGDAYEPPPGETDPRPDPAAEDQDAAPEQTPAATNGHTNGTAPAPPPSVFCERCQRVGPAKGCQACKILREQTGAKAPGGSRSKSAANGTPVFDPAVVETWFGKLIRSIDDMGNARGKGSHHERCLRSLKEFFHVFDEWRKVKVGA